MLKDEIYVNGELNMELLNKEKWLYYLVLTNNNAINLERVSIIEKVTGKETLDYVFRTLNILEIASIKDSLKEIIAKVLKWSEVAKGGTDEQRKLWRTKGYPLEIHNLASAEIYIDETEDDLETTKIVYNLIKTHGIIGQNLRGEVSIKENYAITNLLNYLSREDVEDLLVTLNKCIIAAVDDNLWMNIESNVKTIINHILAYSFDEFYTTKERVSKLSNNLKDAKSSTVKMFEKEIFPNFQLWYFDSATNAFSEEQIVEILEKILKFDKIQRVDHLNFKPLANSLYYDYEGKKHINVYKLRIIEKYLRDNSTENVELSLNLENKTLCVDFKFSSVCEKLIDFCVEAERSGLLTFEKSIGVLYEMFGFKRDEFDRLNNEEKYLATMNDAAESKKSIAQKVVGDTIVDVGSGGGIMLDLLEKLYPDKNIIGTDISQNVLIALNEKRNKEGHNWQTLKHNFVEGPLNNKVDSIIFSSILHEIFSYNETENGHFDIESVKLALKNAYHSLNKGGRIVIRDGVKTEGNGTLEFKMKTPEGSNFITSFYNDFKGLPNVDRKFMIKGDTFVGDINFMREFLFTYTWGSESYAHEVHEQFGYFTLNEFKEFFTSIGAKIIEVQSFFEEGYYEHLKDKVDLPRESYPDSNCIIVVEKI